MKWILVSCFGYQGFSNAKFGRIEVHEAINAHARDILLTAKERLEAGGWRVLHGIVDSVWVTPRGGVEQEPLEEIAASVSEAVGIELEFETTRSRVIEQKSHPHSSSAKLAEPNERRSGKSRNPDVNR